MRLDYEPDLGARFELQGVAGSQREVDFHLDSALDARGYDYVPLL